MDIPLAQQRTKAGYDERVKKQKLYKQYMNWFVGKRAKGKDPTASEAKAWWNKRGYTEFGTRRLNK